MLGVVVYRLRTEVGGHFTMFPGKLLHGALFRYFSAYDAALAADVHARQAKPFTVGSLYRTDTVPQDARAFHAPSFSVGSAQFLRVTGLDSDALAAFERMPCGTKLQVGKLVFSVTEVIADGREETGAIAPDVLAAAVLSMEGVRRVRFSFRTPTVFRTDSGDCAVAYPELIFASLADKWTQFSLPGVLHKETARAAAAKLIPLDWHGRGMRIRIAERKTVPGFVGEFSFGLGALPTEEQEIILLLSQFAPFCGTGRMTAQGMGETHIFFS